MEIHGMLRPEVLTRLQAIARQPFPSPMWVLGLSSCGSQGVPWALSSLSSVLSYHVLLGLACLSSSALSLLYSGFYLQFKAMFRCGWPSWPQSPDSGPALLHILYVASSSAVGLQP